MRFSKGNKVDVQMLLEGVVKRCKLLVYEANGVRTERLVENVNFDLHRDVKESN